MDREPQVGDLVIDMQENEAKGKIISVTDDYDVVVEWENTESQGGPHSFDAVDWIDDAEWDVDNNRWLLGN